MIWNIDPVIYNFGFFELRYYSLFFATGIFTSYWLISRFMKEEGMSEESASRLLLYIVFGLIFGAHMIHIIFYEPSAIFNNPERIYNPLEWGKGLASHGGVAGMMLALYIFIRREKKSYLQIADMISVVGGITACAVRLGNFFNSEIIGRSADVPWAVVFKRIDSVPRHPSQLYEAIALVFIFIAVLIVYRKQKDIRGYGFFTGLFFSLYFTARFILEFFKKTQSEMLTDGRAVSMGQWLSIPLVILGLYLIYRARNKPAES